DPVVLVNGAQKHATEVGTYINDVRWYHLPFRPVLVIDVLLTDLGLAGSKIGAEFRHDYMTNISYEVKELMPEASLVDATDILQRLRMIKTENEVEALRDACCRNTTALTSMLEKIRGGMTVREVAWTLAECEREQGATSVSTGLLMDIWNVDGGGEWLRRKSSPDRKLRRGDYVCFDYGMAGPRG
ncbi:MAG: hypothetical protein QW057_06355, partial [Candidatus Bathyarchaeia archaeon]